MSELRSRLKDRKVHSIDPKWGRTTRCNWSLGHIEEPGTADDPAIFNREGSYILVKMTPDLTGVTCHFCRWGRK